MRRSYSSDINREQFEHLRHLLEGAREKTAPRRVDLYEVFCAIVYLLKSGCSWRLLPSDFQKWRTVHAYFQQWSEPPTSFLIVDAQSVKNTDSARQKGYDAGKKVSGIKRHIAVDT